MKSIIGFILLLTTVTIYTQNIKEYDIPDAVKNTFKVNFPDINNVKWDLENGKYEAEFKVNNVEKTAVIDKMGKLTATETDISVNSLPIAVQNEVKNDFPSAEVKEACKIEKSGEINYEAEIKDGSNSWKLIYSEEGKLLKKFHEDSNDDDN